VSLAVAGGGSVAGEAGGTQAGEGSQPVEAGSLAAAGNLLVAGSLVAVGSLAVAGNLLAGVDSQPVVVDSQPVVVGNLAARGTLVELVGKQLVDPGSLELVEPAAAQQLAALVEPLDLAGPALQRQRAAQVSA